jgi:hypothetical protein
VVVGESRPRFDRFDQARHASRCELQLVEVSEIELDRLFRNEPEQAPDPIASVLSNEPHHVVFQRRRALLLPPRQRGRDDLRDVAAEDPTELVAIDRITVSQQVGEKAPGLVRDVT